MSKEKVLISFILMFLIFPLNVFAKRSGCCSHHGGEKLGTCTNGMQVCNDRQVSPTCSCEGGSSTTSNYSNVYGCTNSNAINYNSSANKDDGSCIIKVSGCTDSNAINYNGSANTDDHGSCIAKVLGCTDSNAINYNSSANTLDDSCNYQKITTLKKVIRYKTVYKFRWFRKSGTIIRKGHNGFKKSYY